MAGGSDKLIGKRQDGDVDFFTADPDDLGRVVSSPQAFDNQWMPQDLLKAAAGEARLSDAEAEQERLPYVRTEYLRALVNTGQVVINRAYLYNNPAIYRDYARAGQNREDFKTLLRHRVIVPYLYNEPSPATAPVFTRHGRDQGWSAWVEVLRECAPTCLRLSWDDTENATLVRRLLTNPFGQFLRTLDDLEMPLLVADFARRDEDGAAFGERLRQVAAWAHQRSQDNGRVNREDAYNEFVVRSGSAAGDRNYDPGKPFSAELKQLFDLRYNANLPDALGSYLLTPENSLRRRALQEWRDLRQSGVTDAAQLIHVVSNLNFDQISEVLGALAAFDKLTLGGVIELRSTPDWEDYHGVLNKFLAQPALETFGDPEHGAAAVALAYREVIKQAGTIAARRSADAVQERWDPVIEITVEFAGAILSIFYNPAGNAFRLARDLAPGVGTRTARAVFHLVIGRVTRSRAQSRVDNSLRVLDTRLDHGRQDWQEFVSGLKQQGFRDLDKDPGGNAEQASMEKAAGE